MFLPRARVLLVGSIIQIFSFVAAIRNCLLNLPFLPKQKRLVIYYLMLFFLFFGALFADEDSTVATLANDPSAVVGGAVNVITGELLGSEEDLTIRGVEPIHLSRTYYTRPASG